MAASHRNPLETKTMEASANVSPLSHSSSVNSLPSPKDQSDSIISVKFSDLAYASDPIRQDPLISLKDTLLEIVPCSEKRPVKSPSSTLGVPPNSGNSARGLSKRRTDTHLGSKENPSLLSYRSTPHVKFHSRSNSLKEINPLFKTPQGRASTAASSKASPVKVISSKSHRSLSLDLTGLVDEVDFSSKRKEITRLKLMTRILKSDLSRIYWDDFRDVKYTIETEKREGELYELQYTHHTEINFRRQTESQQRIQNEDRKSLRALQSKDNKEVKKVLLSEKRMKQHDELARSNSALQLSRYSKDRLTSLKQSEAEEKRMIFLEQVQIQKKAQVVRQEEERQDLLKAAQKRIDDMFEQALKENQETMEQLMTAKYSRKAA